MRFSDINTSKPVHLYLGDMTYNRPATPVQIGVSLTRDDSKHVKHDITNRFDLPDNSVDSIQSEDVTEHIEYDLLVDCFDELHRILKPGALFRLSMPDYGCDILKQRSLCNDRDEVVFDPGGGGSFNPDTGRVSGGGHVWFPVYDNVKQLLDRTRFTNINYLHYYDSQNKPVLHTIDHSLGMVKRTPDHDPRVQQPARPMSIVVDCYK